MEHLPFLSHLDLPHFFLPFFYLASLSLLLPACLCDGGIALPTDTSWVGLCCVPLLTSFEKVKQKLREEHEEGRGRGR